MEEIWDAYNEKEERLGIDLIRGNKLPEGAYHLVVSVLVQHIDGDYLLMQRDFKKTWSGFFEATAGGAVLKGETPEAGAIREVKEETGLTVEHLALFKKNLNPKRQIILYHYIAKTSDPKEAVTLQPGETMAYKWLNYGQFLLFLNSKDCIPGQAVSIKAYLKSEL